MGLELCLHAPHLWQEVPLYGLLLTFGAALVIEEAIRVLWGPSEQHTCSCRSDDQLAPSSSAG